MKLGYAQAGSRRSRTRTASSPSTRRSTTRKDLTSGHVSRVTTHTHPLRHRSTTTAWARRCSTPPARSWRSRRRGTSTADARLQRLSRGPHRRGAHRDRGRRKEDADDGQPPSATPLPVEPQRPLRGRGVEGRPRRAGAGSLGAYQVSAADFDVSLITPVLIYGARHQGDRPANATGRGDRNPIGGDAERDARARRLRKLVRLRPRLPAGADDPRDAEAGRELLEDDRARRGVDPGHLAAAVQTDQGRLLPDAGLLRRGRGDAHPSLQDRTARRRHATPSTKVCTSSTRRRSVRTAPRSS